MASQSKKPGAGLARRKVAAKKAAPKTAAKTAGAKKTAKPGEGGRPALQDALNPLTSVLKGAWRRREGAGKGRTAASPPPVEAAPHRSPLAPEALPDLHPIDGVSLATATTGIKYKNRPDLLVARFAPATTVAGVFTQSATAAAPVDWCRGHLDRNDGAEAGLLIVNAGNANAFTGKAGMAAVKTIAAAGAKAAKCRQKNVLIASTGVIGEPLPTDPIVKVLPALCDPDRQAAAPPPPQAWAKAAHAITTTDTFPKAATATAQIDGVPVTVNGIAKGSGMIAPDMATMLAFIFTDATLPGAVLQTLLLLGVRDTFNTVTVDGDTSTNDTVLAFATGQRDHAPIKRAGDRRLADFRTKWHSVLHDLALQIVRDGEGATKLIRVMVSGAETTRAATLIARSIAHSPLVKTAIAGEDANWGRIVMAVGKAGAAIDPTAMTIRIGGLPVASGGARDPAYDEAALARHMKEQTIDLAVDVGLGTGTATVWTCDLTHGYIAINADYRS
ncbi:MAG: bifunctional glutamate N-acetyltransferase/amino-acid acetyltransferase ArgJ [Alphaproteobacteria bacterium]